MLITDGINQSFAIFTFKCGSLGWSGRATVGFNAGGSYYVNHPLSGSQLSNAIACANPDSEWNNIVYDLTPITSGSKSISGSGSESGSGLTSGSESGYGEGFDAEVGEYIYRHLVYYTHYCSKGCCITILIFPMI